MDDAVEDLVLAPFREIVAQGTAALRIADDEADGSGGGDEEGGMRAAAATALLREGERALRRLEPLCRRKCDEVGGAFVEALRGDADISRLVEQLNDLLYDFEEFVGAGSFAADKFGELQALSRRAAPVISHRITRMRLGGVVHGEEHRETASSPASFGPTVLIRHPSNEVGSLPYRQSTPYPEDVQGDRDEYAAQWPPSRVFDTRQPDTPPGFPLPTVLEEGSPPEHSVMLDPWSRRSQDIEEGLELIRRRRETSSCSDSAIGSEANSEHTDSPSIIGQQQQQQEKQPPVPPKSPARLVTPTATLGPSFEQTASFVRSYYGRDSISPRPQQQRDSGALSLSTNASLRSSREGDSYFEAVSPLSSSTSTRGLAESEASLNFRPRDRSPVQSLHVLPLFTAQAFDSSPTSQAGQPIGGMEPVVLPPPGLMMVEEKQACEPMGPLLDLEEKLGGCAINLNSSYYQFKGFCAGAVEIIQGGLGIKRIKKQVSWEKMHNGSDFSEERRLTDPKGISAGNMEIARCKACSFELEWKAVERDVNNEGRYAVENP